jgi:hypothetical protein
MVRLIPLSKSLLEKYPHHLKLRSDTNNYEGTSVVRNGLERERQRYFCFIEVK